EIDMVTGATVTIQVLDQTLVTSARQVGEALGLIEGDSKRIVTWKSGYVPKTWSELLDEGSIGHLRIEAEEIGVTDANGKPWLDLYYGDVTQPVTGINILGESTYNWLKENLEEGEKIIFVVSNGISSFKGSGFVRGGIFDRFNIEQGNFKITFRDLDYENLYGIKAEGAPEFRETGIFIVRNKLFDSSNKWRFNYVANRLTGETALSKIFKTFHSEYQFYEKYFDVEVIHRVQPSYVKKIWENSLLKVIFLTLFLSITFGIFFARKWLTYSKKRLITVHIAVMILSVIIIGFILKSPPSITHLYPLIRVFQDGFRVDLYLSDPIQFVFWIFIAVSLIIWGRGWFCGWICPYGNVLELTSRLARKISPEIFSYEFPPKIHEGLRAVRYAVLGVLVGFALISVELAEKSAEIEPFKSTWLVNIFSREWYFIGYWVALLIISTFNFRFFCRYVCPLGAAFSLGSVFRLIGIERRGCCTQCKICAHACDSKSINDKGEINKYDCYYCLECEQVYNDDKACPPLIYVNKMKYKGKTIDLTNPCKNPDL
ncbi:MAG: 4Fe-4S binding protein, partial [Gammaproteobacteria bacterium]|nr:4Fe-4S binding protein [Gammaproteobacteria bacterium]